MAEAATSPGAMTAVAQNVDQVRQLIADSGIDVVVANDNSPNQVVLSGSTSSIEKIEAKLAEQDVMAKRLTVATAFHSPVVSGASTAFTEFLDAIEFKSPAIPVHANETAQPYPADVAQIRAQLGRQLANPVRFVEMVEAMYADGARTFVEVGPSSILTGLVSRILKDRSHTAIQMDEKNKAGLAPFLGGLGRLVAAGIPMDLAPLWSEHAEPENPHEIEKPGLVIPINGSNYGKPYPPQDLSELVGPNPERQLTTSMSQQRNQVFTPAPQAVPTPVVETPAAHVRSTSTDSRFGCTLGTHTRLAGHLSGCTATDRRCARQLSERDGPSARFIP